MSGTATKANGSITVTLNGTNTSSTMPLLPGNEYRRV